jgi:hypothetical protein
MAKEVVDQMTIVAEFKWISDNPDQAIGRESNDFTKTN